MEKTGLKLTDMPDEALAKLAEEQNQAAFIVLYTRYNIGVKSHILPGEFPEGIQSDRLI